MDLDGYFARIAWRGARTPTADVLAGIVERHVTAIPFENVDVLLGRPPQLAVDALEAKLVGARRGGYCFEHATLLAAVLCELGFTVHTHSARVVMMTSRDHAPRTHMFLTVGGVALDPGFGRQAPLVPVPLDGTPAREHRFAREGSEIALYLGEQRLWVSSLEHDLPIDFEMANYYTATHAWSPFVNHLLAHALIPGGRVTIVNRALTIIRDGHSEVTHLADRVALRGAFATHFGFDLPELETVRIPAVPEWT